MRMAVENGFTGSEADWLASIKGDEGTEGKSAYELYCELFGYEGTEEQWLIDLRTGALISFNVTFDLNGGEAPRGICFIDHGSRRLYQQVLCYEQYYL